jgi:hypothetical protein
VRLVGVPPSVWRVPVAIVGLVAFVGVPCGQSMVGGCGLAVVVAAVSTISSHRGRHVWTRVVIGVWIELQRGALRVIWGVIV